MATFETIGEASCPFRFETANMPLPHRQFAWIYVERCRALESVTDPLTFFEQRQCYVSSLAALLGLKRADRQMGGYND